MMNNWAKDFRRAMKDFMLQEGVSPEVEALIQNIESTLSRLSPKTKRDQRDIEVALHNLNQIRKKYRREVSELNDLKNQINVNE